jgi:hypothetical protein
MTTVFVLIFGKFNDSDDFALDIKDNNVSINVSQNSKEVK